MLRSTPNYDLCYVGLLQYVLVEQKLAQLLQYLLVLEA
jgi:hypothetical protein